MIRLVISVESPRRIFFEKGLERTLQPPRGLRQDSVSCLSTRAEGLFLRNHPALKAQEEGRRYYFDAHLLPYVLVHSVHFNDPTNGSTAAVLPLESNGIVLR